MKLVILALFCFQWSATSESLFYIYDWPNELDDVWPPPNSTLHPKSGYDHGFYANNGAGELLESDIGLFQTWQFGLYKNVMARLRVSKYRTRDPTKAVSFIIPFDLGVNSYIDHLTGQPRLAAPQGRLAKQLLRNTCNGENSHIFWKNKGHDHFVFMAITAYQMVGIMVKEFYMNVCQNCTVITIETSPTNTAIPGRTRKSWYAAPYPSSFHWHENIKILPWNIVPKRDILSLFIGSVKPSQPASRKLRTTLHSQCIQNPTLCHWFETLHACNGVVNASNVMLLFRRSIFCPAPPGDSITRKSIFDALVAGCIPVLFSRASLSQYSWHLTEKEVDEVSVYIPLYSINNNNENFINILKSYTPEDILKKQMFIEKYAPKLQYSIIPKHITNEQNKNPNKDLIWAPPFEDASDVIINKILDRKTVEPITGYSDEELLRQHMQQKEIMNKHEDFSALRLTKESFESNKNNENNKVRKIRLQDIISHVNVSTTTTLTRISKVCRKAKSHA
eukprot:gene4876-9723_t